MLRILLDTNQYHLSPPPVYDSETVVLPQVVDIPSDCNGVAPDVKVNSTRGIFGFQDETT